MDITKEKKTPIAIDMLPAYLGIGIGLVVNYLLQKNLGALWHV